ncbi:hypothetical protein SAMN05421788_113160 [Filimonas lacunae]|uniref:Uncharacterized protein n=1 Tax=Filimonas lacunae TaxID=477680 RepID=A0A1N7RFC2_9BACT|nr:hypothetical protein SAMN05421788_113160 [Filimonas lacunae]
MLGFSENAKGLVAILQQPYIRGGHANLADIESLLNYNDFFKTKKQDYYNQTLGIALEDMHDENVVAKDETLFFIDTIFYILEVQ